MNIGLKIKELRQENKLTQEDLADQLGVSFQAVSRWENGLSCPDITMLPKLAEYFSVSIDELMEYKPVTSLNSLYFNMKSLIEEEATRSVWHELIYNICMIASTCLSKNET